METCLIQLRSEIEIINPFEELSSARKPRFTKTGRWKAVTALNDALTRRQVIAALTAVSKQEMIRGPVEEPDKLLGWGELSCTMLLTLNQVCTETANARTASRPGSTNMRPVYMKCFRSILKLALQHGPPGVLRHLVRPVLSYCHDWLSEPSLRDLLSDQIWQCVRDILLDEVNRALLLPAYVKTWTDACFEQLTGRGALRHSSDVVTNIAGEVLQVIASSVASYDTLSQTTRRASPSTMLGGDFSYAFIAERCCMMLIVADSMPRRKAREVQSVAFRTLTIILTDHAVDFAGSSALNSIANASLKPLLSCWFEKKYHLPAISFCKVLLLLDPCSKRLIDAVRHRILVDLREESSSAIIRTGKEISTDYVYSAAACFTFSECLEFAGSTERTQGVVIFWLRVAFVILSGRVLKRGTSLVTEAADVLDQCSKAADVITLVLKKHGNIRNNDYFNVIQCCTRITKVAAVLAEKIRASGTKSSSVGKASWQDLYTILREHAMKARYSIRSHGANLKTHEASVQSEDLILQTLTLLCSLEIIDNSTIEHSGVEGNQLGSEPYPVSRLLTKGTSKPTRFEIEYFRSVVCRTGLAHDSGGKLRFQLVSTLMHICYDEHGKSSTHVTVLEEAAASVLALVRGECALSEQEYTDHRTAQTRDSFNLIALHSLESFFGMNLTRQKIVGDGGGLVRGVSDQDSIWKDFCSWNTQSCFLSGCAAQAILGDSKPVLIDPLSLTQSRHFSISSQSVRSLEKELLEYSQEVFNRAVLRRQKENLSTDQNGSERCRAGDLAQCEEVAFLDREALGKGLRLIIFLSCYMFQGTRLGLLSVASYSVDDSQGPATELADLLLNALRSVASSNPEDLLSNCNLTQEAVKWSSRLCTVLANVHENHSSEEPENTRFNMQRALSRSVISITTSLSKYLFRKLEQYDLKTVEVVQGFAEDGLAAFISRSHDTRNRRKRRRASRGSERLSKRRRERSPAFSEESVDSGDSERSLGRSAALTERMDPNLIGEFEDSDDLHGITDDEPDDNDWGVEEELVITSIENKANYWRKSFAIIDAAVRELEHGRELILETLIHGLKELDDVERALSPDGFERAALLSSLIDLSMLEARRWIWDVLLSVGAGNALKAVADDLLKIGTYWQRLEQTDHEYVSYYADLIELGKRKQYPVLPKTEESRVLFLHYARELFQKALKPNTANRETNVQQVDVELRRLAVEIVGTSEYFRERHAFRMPRITRIAYLRFAHSFLHLVECFQTKTGEANQGTLEETSIIETAHLLRNVMCKFLADSECIVRIVASTIVPKALALGFWAEPNSLERTLDASLPLSTSCDDSKEFYGISGRLQDNTRLDTTYTTWNPSNDECNAFSMIHESFRLVGASAKGYSTFMCLSELAIKSENLIPYCIIQIVSRVAANSRFLCSGYHVLVRLCSALNYQSPSHLYAAFSRLLLPKWFEMQDSTDAIYGFPASLFVNNENHKEGILYDWLRDHQTDLLAHILVHEKATSLDLTVKFAAALQEDPASLLKRNVPAFALLYPMQFTDGLHDRGKLLWHAVDSLLEGSSMTLMFEKKSDVINAFLRSVSTNWNRRLDSGKVKPHSADKMGFSRDTRTLKPPFYDALVIALAINHLFASDSDIFIVQRSVLQGSLFAEVRDEQTGHVLADRFVEFLKECQRTNVTLLRILASILRFFEGPPSPQPKRSSLDAFFCVGMLWRMLDDAVLMKPKNERVIFFRLIANGFRQEQTARDAIWLLSDVQTKLMRLHLKHPRFTVSESELDTEEPSGCNLEPMTTSRERQMYELLSTVSPVLMSIMVNTSLYRSDLRCVASKALMDLLNLCSEASLWNAVLSNGPFPRHRLFKDARKIYERARSVGQASLMDDKVGYVLSSMSRFRRVYKGLSIPESSVNILACLQETSNALDEDTANKVSKVIKSEAWLRSNGILQKTLPQVSGTLSCLLDLIFKFSPAKNHGKKAPFSKAFRDGPPRNRGGKEVFEDLLLQEAARLISILGLLQSHSSSFMQAETYYKPIPPKQLSGHYEEVESGIRLSLLLLQDLLHSNLPVQVQIGLDTLLAILKTNDGRRIYGKQKSLFGNLNSFKGSDRVASKSMKLFLPFSEPLTGTIFPLSSFPDLRSPELWSLPKGDASDEYSLWMRKLCAVLAHRCRSNALKSLAPACFASYRVSCDMLPYLFMDIICDLDEESCSDVSKLLRHHILLNVNAPIPLIRAFVHALDVLCQIGLEVVSSKGVLSWVRNTQETNAYPFYYVLEVPYLEAAQAALRSGASFSALRYAQLYIDQRAIKAEIKQSAKIAGHRSERRYSSYPLRDPVVESAEITAREKALPLVREAMLRISEPDGIRAFGENCSLARSAANIAALDGDWSRSLSALDVATRSSNPMSPESLMQSDSRDRSATVIDFQKELDVLHSFIRLGTIQIATDYWDGLRNRVCRLAIPGKSHYNLSTNQFIDQLNELRFAAAWKLEQWDSPPILPQKGARAIGDHIGPLGFHKAVYLTLRSFMTRRYADIPSILSRARQTILQRFCDGTSTFSGKSLFENSSRLHIYHVLERLAIQEVQPNCRVKAPVAIRPASFEEVGSQSCRTIGDSNPEFPESADIQNQNLDGEDVINQILGDFYGVGDETFSNGLVISRDAFHSGVLSEDIPVILIRCLKKTGLVARMSATTSARILSKGDAGAWPRATSCLGTMQSSLLDAAPQKDVIAWKLQETRLRWSANHDAPSKKQALAAVKDIISNNLGGKALDRTSSDASDSSSFQQSLSWQRGEIDGETLAMLRSQACILAARWSLDMKTHEPMDLFQMYLESGLVAATQNSQMLGRAHFAMASFADSQLSNIDSYRKSRKYDSMVTAVTEMEDKISNLKKMKAERKLKVQSQGRSSRQTSRASRSAAHSDGVTEKQIIRDLDAHIRTEQKKAMQDRARLEKLNETYQKWQLLACRHFALSLCAGGTEDLRAAFRMVALWLDAGQMRTKVTAALIENPKLSSSKQQKIMVPVSKLLPLAPQLASRLNKSETIADPQFQKTLSETITEMAGNFPAHCLWQLLALSNATRDSGSQEKYSSLYRGDQDKKDAADDILNRLQDRHGETVSEMKQVALAYILLSETDEKRKENDSLELRRYTISQLGELRHVPVPTVPIPLSATDSTHRIPYIAAFEKRASVCAGLSKPLKVVCVGSDGERYPQMVKGRDDLRGDAVMEQMFTILNSLLEKEDEAARRSLHIRTYRIIPLSPFSGIMQFVSNTTQFRQVLVERKAGAGGKVASLSLHERYHPKDLKHGDILGKAFQYLKEKGGGSQKVIQFLKSVWHRFQPAFRFFFTEQWPDPGQWFRHQLNYSRSVAVMSMVGFVLGLGDRHLANILLDVSTAEVVHIDFGIAFEQGKLLPTPEHMPFRLTRDLVDGFGAAGVEGVFRRCSEITLSVMRTNKDVMLTVIEVLLHDPMYSWALTPEEVLREQKQPQGSDGEYFESNEFSRSFDESCIDACARNVSKKLNGSKEAQRALMRISEKLDGLEGTERLSVEAHVARLIDEAQAFHVLASVYPGWSPWL